MLIVGFLLFSATAYYLFKGLLILLGLYGVHIGHQKRFVVAATVVISGLIALQSIGQLGPKDVVVMIILALLFYLYTSYAKASQRKLIAK